MKITVFGSSSDKPDTSYFESVNALASALSDKGHEIIYGAGKNGLIGSFAKRFYHAGGKLTGISTLLFKDSGDVYENCSELILCDDIKSRIHTMTDIADCFLVLPGGIGTYEELFGALCANMTGSFAKAIIIFNINGCYSPLFTLLHDSVNGEFSSKACLDYIFECKNSAEVLSALDRISETEYKKRSIYSYHTE